MKMKLSDIRKIIREEIDALSHGSLNENIGFETRRPQSILPKTYEDFRKCLEASFIRLSMPAIAGKVSNLNESNSVIDAVSKMWDIVERENRGYDGTPPPHFSEGREFWDYFGPAFIPHLSKLVESQIPGTGLARENSTVIAKNIIDMLRAGSK